MHNNKEKTVLNTNSDIPLCNEEFALDDNITRRIIYPLARTNYENVVSEIFFNFTKDHFLEGATKWSDLREPYASLFFKIMNLVAHTIGNKKIDNLISLTPQQQTKKRKQNPQSANNANNNVQQQIHELETWFGNLKRSDQIFVNVETLFDTEETTRVSGFRIGIFSKITKSPIVLQQQQQRQQQQQQLLNKNNSYVPNYNYNTVKIPVDVLSIALNNSFLETNEIKRLYEEQLKHNKYKPGGAGRGKKTDKAIDKVNTSTRLDKLYLFTSYTSILNSFLLFRKTLTSDVKKKKDDDDTDGFPFFSDTRQVMDIQYMSHHNSYESSGSTDNNTGGMTTNTAISDNIIKNMFTKEAAMYYHVREANILPEQRNINTYIDANHRIRNPESINDVKELSMKCSDASFTGYYNPRTTYAIITDFLSPEVMSKMPTPHRMGAILHKTTTNIKSNELKKKKKGLNIMMENDDQEEDDQEEDNNQEEEEVESVSNEIDISVSILDQLLLDNEDLDGTLALKLLDNPLCYGYKSNGKQKPLGIHDVQYNVSITDILKAKSTLKELGLTRPSVSDITDDIKKRFLSKRKGFIKSLIEGTTMLNNRQLKTIKFLTCETENNNNTLLSNNTNNNKNNNDVDELYNEASNADTVYKSSTLSYIVRPVDNIILKHAFDDFKNTVEDGEEEEEELTQSLDEGDIEIDDNINNTDLDEQSRAEYIKSYMDENNDFLGDYNEFESPGKSKNNGDGGDNNTENEGVYKNLRFFKNKDLDKNIPFLGTPTSPGNTTNNKNINMEWESFVARASVDITSTLFDKRRPKGNSMEDVRDNGDIVSEEFWKLERDVNLRICMNNKKAHRSYDNEFFNPTLKKIPNNKYEAYRKGKGRLMDAMVVEVWNEFHKNGDVSYANEGIRDDWEKSTTELSNGKKRINHSHSTRISRLNVRPYHQYKIWCYNLFAVILLIHYNFKLMYNNYTFKYHHCRYYYDSTDPKNNAINAGDNMGGKSYMLRGVKKTCPSRVGDMVTVMTPQAFNVDRNLNDMLIIIEEMEGKYLGINSGGGKSGSAQPNDDAVNFFKSRLTSGETMVLEFFKDEEHGNRRDCKQSRSSCQGIYLCATNAKLADADKNLLSRFIILSVPKNFGDNSGSSKGNDKIILQAALDDRRKDVLYEQHRDIHRLYFFTEQCIKSNVLNNCAYGVSIDAANIFINQILDDLSCDFKIPTSNNRKRNAVLEMARSMCIAFACWNALTSPVLEYLQYDPITSEYLGINPRLIARGIFPFLIITKDMVIDALTSLSTIWQHDHLKNVLASYAKSTQLLVPIEARYRQIPLAEADQVTIEFDKHNQVKNKRNLSVKTNSSSKSKSRKTTTNDDMDDVDDNVATVVSGKPASLPTAQAPVVGSMGRNNIPQFTIQTIPDYNYVQLCDRSYEAICKNIAKDLGEIQVSSNTIEQILRELAEDQSDMALPSYRLQQSNDKTDPYGELVLDINRDATFMRKLVIFDVCPKTRKSRISILVSYLKEQLPTMLHNKIVQNLRNYQQQSKRLNKIDNDSDYDDDDDDYENSEDNSNDTNEEKSEKDDLISKKRKRGKDKDDYNDNEGEEDDDEDIQNKEKSEKKRKSKSNKSDKDDKEEEEEDSLTKLIKLLKESALYNAKNATPIINVIRKKYENSIYGRTNIPAINQSLINNQYKTVYSNIIPYDQYATADAADQIHRNDIFPDLPTRIKHKKEFTKEIAFHDTMKTLILKQKFTGNVIIPNYAYVSPSALASLSTYDSSIKENDVIKLTNHIFNTCSSWLLTEDIDYTYGKAHLANIAYEPIDIKDSRFICINYHEFLYQLHCDYSRIRLDKEDKEIKAERELSRLQNPSKANEAKLLHEEEEESMKSVFCEYPLCDMLSRVTAIGNIIKSMIYGVDLSQSIPMERMLMSNCDVMRNSFILTHPNVIRCRKRIEYETEEAKQAARNQANNTLQKRLTINVRKKTTVNKNENTSKSNMKQQQQQQSSVNKVHETTSKLSKTNTATSTTRNVSTNKEVDELFSGITEQKKQYANLNNRLRAKNL